MIQLGEEGTHVKELRMDLLAVDCGFAHGAVVHCVGHEDGRESFETGRLEVVSLEISVSTLSGRMSRQRIWRDGSDKSNAGQKEGGGRGG